MRQLKTEILVIGGGATGTGVLRDLAMRGFSCLLVERRDLAYGTTGRYHGLLHSGSRYVVKDPAAARECYQENQILRRIMPQCIEDTGGLFVLTPFDDPAYVPQFLEGCARAGIPVENVPIHQMLKEEPALNQHIEQCFRVPDGAADSFLATELNAESARQYGAQVLNYHEVTQLVVNSSSDHGMRSLTGVICHDLVKDEEVQIDTSMVINASGAWAGKIASLAGINLIMVPGKGTMVALNHRIVNHVINRCKPPSDGDILVPTHTVAVMGTTDIRVADPDHYAIEPGEIRLMLDEGEKLVPDFKKYRILRTWAGVRPLVQETSIGSNRDISRAFVLIDHAERDSVEGLLTITSGKWTTYRKMAQVTVDRVCEKLMLDRPCRTDQEVLPSPHDNRSPTHYLGTRLEIIENNTDYGNLICECELVTRDDLEKAIIQSDNLTLDDIRRDTRIGMGPCQGAFCTLRTAGILHAFRRSPIQDINTSIRDFLQERWKGNLPVLWGQQLRQERLNELIYINILNAPHLPGDISSQLASDAYAQSSESAIRPPNRIPLHKNIPQAAQQVRKDVVIIGAGLAGLIAARQLSAQGFNVKIISKGWGSTHWGSGCIDIFGYALPDYSESISSPIDYLEELAKSNPDHPYALAGLDILSEAAESFLKLSEQHGYPFSGSLSHNYLLPTSLGTLRPTCLIPSTMLSGDAQQKSPMLIVGFDRFHDFYPGLISDNLNAQGLLAQDLLLEIQSLQVERFLTPMVLARKFDHPEFRQEVIEAIRHKLGHAQRVGLPAVLGLKHSLEAKQHLETELGLPVFEIPGLPPSVPGIRLNNMLAAAIQENHGIIDNGMQVTGYESENGHITHVYSEAAVRLISHPASRYILATGGILGGGVITSENGYAMDTVFDLPINAPTDRLHWFADNFLTGTSHPIHHSGFHVDSLGHPLDDSNHVIFSNLQVIGSALGNCDPIRERSVEGIALATAFHVVDSTVP